MKIEYKILWLDDKIDEFIEDDIIADIEEHLKNLGFKPNIQPTSRVDDFLSKLDDTYDLILTDYHMKDMNGDKVVEEIRKPARAIFTEILFYTAQADLKDTNKISRISFLETNDRAGSHHEVLIEEIIKLIDLTIKKFQHIVSMRGMIMHETSSLDQEKISILKSFIGQYDYSAIASSIFSKLLSQLKTKLSEVEKLSIGNKLNQLMKDNWVFSADYKIQALSEILKQIGAEDFSAAYKEEIINRRNKFAHAELLKDEKTGREFFKHGEDGITFDEALCKQIRKDIIKHQANLDNLKMKLAKGE